MHKSKTTKPRVLQVISHLDLGGAENIAISLAETMHSDFDFTFFAVGGVADNDIGREMQGRLETLGAPIHSGTAMGLKRGGVVQAALRLNRLIRRLRPALVHLHTEIPETTFALAALLGLPPGVRVLRTIHNSTLWPAWQRVGRWVEGRLGAAEVIAVSEGSLQGLWRFQEAHGVSRTPREQAQVIYNGVADVIGTSPRAERPPLNGRPVQVLFAGRFEPEKGIDLLPPVLTAASGLTQRRVEVNIVGRGALGEQIRLWVQEQRLPWQVAVGEPVPNLPARLGEYDVLLMPSRFEGLALVAIEALLAGTPVVAARAPGLREVFPPGYPLLAEPENVAELAAVLAYAVDHVEDCAARVQRDRRLIAERFSLGGMADRYRHVYRSVIGAPSAAVVAP